MITVSLVRSDKLVNLFQCQSDTKVHSRIKEKKKKKKKNKMIKWRRGREEEILWLFKQMIEKDIPVVR